MYTQQGTKCHTIVGSFWCLCFSFRSKWLVMSEWDWLVKQGCWCLFTFAVSVSYHGEKGQGSGSVDNNSSSRKEGLSFSPMLTFFMNSQITTTTNKKCREQRATNFLLLLLSHSKGYTNQTARHLKAFLGRKVSFRVLTSKCCFAVVLPISCSRGKCKQKQKVAAALAQVRTLVSF